MQALEPEEFLCTAGVAFDVRSPGEYSQGRIPGAINLPLFTNEERAEVGTKYKQCGKDAAVELGLGLVGPKLASFVATAKRECPNTVAKVHCWRGGMRSSSMAWLLSTAGFKTVTLRGGYKAFRKWVLQKLSQPLNLLVLGGLTGAGKTAILHALREKGEQILDLEDLACHRGSAFGVMGQQPTNEQFENEIAIALQSLDLSRQIWVEDESRMIGRCKVPDALFAAMRQQPLVMLERPKSERVAKLLADYSQAPRQSLIEAVERLQRRLGGARSKQIIQLIHENQLPQAVELLLDYYDAAYRHSLSRRPSRRTFSASGLTPSACAENLLNDRIPVDYS